jgi:hypothetical protein
MEEARRTILTLKVVVSKILLADLDLKSSLKYSLVKIACSSMVYAAIYHDGIEHAIMQVNDQRESGVASRSTALRYATASCV